MKNDKKLNKKHIKIQMTQSSFKTYACNMFIPQAILMYGLEWIRFPCLLFRRSVAF